MSDLCSSCFLVFLSLFVISVRGVEMGPFSLKKGDSALGTQFLTRPSNSWNKSIELIE